ncbi:MAG TPA: toll/interleukin-1 receptor domain-containing protein [Dyella sp.]|uniref:toll/interleukin-1 receptor domain-containing protein n=1 Tax=Dyella sp. TaxID=1869338 RepID=UPI002B5AA7F0|nr:toll/interleukin-1 receptor domain-containing protein [Dyella sp.]HTV83915.1 toll/interleukin-1 receptor domain-containing protein [Dyella sp.]
MRQSLAAADFRYRAFISYSHRDASWAAWLHKALETYRVPARLVGKQTTAGITPRRLAPIFRDRDELASATDLGSKVREALAQSANLIVICSPFSAVSQWVQEEVLAYQRLGRGEHIFCLIVDGEPGADAHADVHTDVHAQGCFAPALLAPHDAQGRPMPAEPIAADARADKDGRRNAKLKLIAGMLGLSFDSLKQRDLQRRNRRLSVITALALAVATVTASLAIVAMHARRAAVVARADAERRQRQAEDLVDFMLGDLNDKLHEAERLDIIEDVDNKAMTYFASMPITDVTDQVLAQRAKVLEKIGSVRQEQGHYAQAIASFEAAASLAASLAAKAPRDLPRQLRLARILAFIGQAHWYDGQLDPAQDAFERARGVLLKAQPHAARNLDLQFELEMLDNDLGHVLEARGRLDDALVPYTHALALSRQLVAAQPQRADFASELGGAHNNLGKLALLRGDLADALAQYRADDAIESALAARHPQDISQRDAQLTVQAILGRTLALAGADEAGMRYMQQAVDTAKDLVRNHPDNSDFQQDLARYGAQLARLKRLNGDMAAATALTAQSLAIIATLLQQSPGDADLQRLHGEILTEQSAQSLASRRVHDAQAQAQAAAQALKPLLAGQPHERSVVLASMAAQWLLAATSTDTEAAKRWRQDMVALAQAQTSGRGDPRLLAMEAQALLALGDTAKAQPLVKQLWDSGYRDAQWLAVLQRGHLAYPINAAFRQRMLAQNPAPHSLD